MFACPAAFKKTFCYQSVTHVGENGNDPEFVPSTESIVVQVRIN